MNLTSLLRKLEPLAPADVRKWRSRLPYLDPSLRSLLEKHIHYTARKLLGDYERKLLLPPPSKAIAAGEIKLGTVLYDGPKWPFGLRREELLQNMAIFGRSGAGKTNVSFVLLEELIRLKVPFLFLDWKRTCRHLLPRLGNRLAIYTPGRSLAPFPFNPFLVPPGLEPQVYAGLVVDVLADAFTLGDGARSLIQRALLECYAAGNQAPSVAELLGIVESTKDKERVRGWKITAIRALESLAVSEIIVKDKASQIGFAEQLLTTNTVLELDGLNQGGKKFLIPLLCLWLFYVRLGASTRERLCLVILVEEAHHVLYRHEQKASETALNMMLRQCREVGISMIVIDQHPHLISSAALGNTFTSLCLNQKDPADINRAASLCLLGEEDRKHFSRLAVGEAIVKMQDRWRDPFLIRFPLVKVQKGVVMDDVLQRLQSQSLSLSGLKRLAAKQPSALGHARGKDYSLQVGDEALIQDVLLYPTDGVDRRYKRLGWSVEKGNRIKTRLVGGGLLESADIQVGQTRRVHLRVSSHASKNLGLKHAEGVRGSLVHEFWKHHCFRYFTRIGYQASIESPRQGGRVDVLAQRGAESVAVEIETGKSNVVENVRRNLSFRVSRVLVVTTDKAAERIVLRRLAQHGLLIPHRVFVFSCLEYEKRWSEVEKAYREDAVA